MGGRGKKSGKGTRSKPKRTATVACIDSSGPQLIADPWIGLRSPLGGKLSPAEEWKRIQNPAARGRELMLRGDAGNALLQASTAEALRVAKSNDQVQELGQVQDVGADEEAAERTPTVDNRPVERLAFRVESLTATNISVCARGPLTTGLVSVDVSETRLDDAGLDSVVTWTPWLRELIAAGNNITRIPLLSTLGKLQALDLGRNRITSLPTACFPLELGPTLRRLNLEDNMVERLSVPTAGSPTDTGGATSKAEPVAWQQQSQQHLSVSSLTLLTSLVDLNVARNKFDAHSAEHSLGVFTKAGFPRLSTLDVRGNNLPAEEESRELLRISAVLPTLKTLNGEAIARKALTLTSRQPMFELLSTGDQCAKEGRREESCSCTEGNPCAVSYHCRDWANRFEIAAAACSSANSAKKT